jgi:hypothetical protein
VSESVSHSISKATSYIAETNKDRGHGVQVALIIDIDGKLLVAQDLSSLSSESYRVRLLAFDPEVLIAVFQLAAFVFRRGAVECIFDETFGTVSRDADVLVQLPVRAFLKPYEPDECDETISLSLFELKRHIDGCLREDQSSVQRARRRHWPEL